MTCPSCGKAVREGAKFCNECGTPLAQACPGCGQPYQPGQKFCEECGGRLTDNAPTAAAPVEHEPAPATPEMRMVSVLFVDLVGFTSLSEKRDAEDVRELLGRYFDSTRTIIERHGGVVEKFIGDAVMAVWGVPVAREDDAERAVRTAIEVVDAVTAFGEDVGDPNLRARAGVVTGQVAALENPGEGLVVGDRVNTASRVQSAAEPGSVYVDEVTRQASAVAIAFEDAGEHPVKGKTEPLRLWRALRVVAGARGSQREQGLEAPLVGREHDLRLLKDLFHAALERRSARLVAISGEAGVGKSRLRREFLNYVDGLAETVLWHSGRCLSYGEGVAYWALAEMVRQRLGITEEAEALEASSKLAAGLERWVPEADDREFIRPRLGALLGVADPGLERAELFAGWRLFFERLASHMAVVLVFEDVQWADRGLLDFVEQLLDWSAQSPIFMLTLSRPELAAGRAGWPAGRRGATLIQLEPLGEETMRELLASLVDGLSPAAAGRVVTQAQGVPLYAIETIRALADRGVLAERDGRLEVVGELGELDVPASLSSLLAARLDALAPAERAVVKAMSLFGGAFPRATAAALGDVPEEQLDDILDSLVRKQVFAIRADPLSPDRGQYAFAQELLRTVAYELLSRQERKPRHLAAAEHLRQAFPNDGEDVAEVIAAHYLDAYRAAQGDSDADELRTRTIAALRRSAQRASTVGAPESAERAFLTAFELVSDDGERAELAEAAGGMAIQAGRFEAALERYQVAADLHRAAERERDAARLAGRTASALGRLGRHAEAIERVSAALEVLGAEREDAEVAELNEALGSALSTAGEHDTAAPHLETALRIAQALKLPSVLCKALADKAALLLWTGRAEEAHYMLVAAIEIAERNSLSEELARALGNSGWLGAQWDRPEAVQQLDSGIALARRRGQRYEESVHASNLMMIQLLRGQWLELERLAAALLGNDSDQTFEAEIHHRLAILHALRGDAALARASLDGLTTWEHTDDAERQMAYATDLIAVLLAEGRLEEALEQGQRILTPAVEKLAAASEIVRQAWPDTLQAALGLGRIEDARRLVQLLAELPPGHIPPYLEAQLARARALIDAAEDRHETAEARLRDVIDQFAALGYPYWLAVTQTDLAEWLIGLGRASEADELLGEAVLVLNELGARPALERLQALAHSDPAAV